MLWLCGPTRKRADGPSVLFASAGLSPRCPEHTTPTLPPGTVTKRYTPDLRTLPCRWLEPRWLGRDSIRLHVGCCISIALSHCSLSCSLAAYAKRHGHSPRGRPTPCAPSDTPGAPWACVGTAAPARGLRLVRGGSQWVLLSLCAQSFPCCVYASVAPLGPTSTVHSGSGLNDVR